MPYHVPVLHIWTAKELAQEQHFSGLKPRMKYDGDWGRDYRDQQVQLKLSDYFEKQSM